mmetsp:Transcript_2376/g.6339  ORF Transcript_2376/g.6339 Transcript_2376/m.6339 type:complete len:128 (+) Transcript_2376:195-578(+)
MGPRGVTAQDSAVFVVGTVPFLWATVEFWTRIAKGKPFGTGKDSVVFDTGREDWAQEDAARGMDANKDGAVAAEQRGTAEDGAKQGRRPGAQRILTKGALRLAYFLMLMAAASGALVVVSGWQAGSA